MDIKKTYETGHVKNVATFQTLISFATAWGETYNPSNEALSLPSLNSLLSDSQTAIAGIDTEKTAYSLAAGARSNAFTPLKPTATRLINALKVSGAPAESVAEALSINRKIQGYRRRTQTDSARTISTSQQSFDNQTENFARLIELLSVNPAYKPNEPELQLTALNAMLTDLRSKNLAVINAYTAYSNAQITRNHLLYAKTTGLVDIAFTVKEYAKSLFGTSSPQYRQISSLEFSRFKK
jgi:hypothetical protein